MPALQDLLGEFGLNQDQVFGGESDFLSQLLRGQAQGGLPPELQAILSSGRRNIGRAAGDALQSGRERFAGTGVGGANFISDIFRNQAGALSDLGTNVGQLGLQNQQSNIRNLLGLNQQQISSGGNTFNQLLGDKQFQQSFRENQRQFDEQNSSSFLDVLGGILGTGVGAFTGGLGGGAASSLFGSLFGNTASGGK